DVFPDPSYGLIGGFLVGGVVQICFQIPRLFRGTSTRFSLDLHLNDPGVRRVLWIMVPGVFAAGVYQVNVFVSQLIASTLDGGSIASLQFSVRLQELVLGLFVVSVAQVILPTLASQTTEGDTDGVRSTLSHASRLMLYVTLPSTAALVVLGEPIVRLLFQAGEFDETSTAMTVFALQFHALGLLPIALARVQQQVFYADKDLKTPTVIAAVVALVNIVLCIVLSRTELKHGGIALAGSIAALVNTLAFVVPLRKKIGSLQGLDLFWRGLRMGGATAVMVFALIGYGLVWTAPADRLALLPWVLLACVTGGAVYIATSALLRVNEFGGLLDAVRRRGARS
ncbi:MAG: lipid II flippase MurJ, partial [Myxococcota bacterium]|nr:lipid II flippase MurJ [Myxococcota bacterium]